jgi:hypothetical protein
MGLLDKSRLSVHGEDVDDGREARRRHGGRARGIVEAIIEAKPKLMQREIGVDALG